MSNVINRLSTPAAMELALTSAAGRVDVHTLIELALLPDDAGIVLVIRNQEGDQQATASLALRNVDHATVGPVIRSALAGIEARLQ